MNLVVLTGRLVKDPELKYTQSQKPVTSNSVAVSKSKDDTKFFNFVAYNNTATYLCNYGKKGQKMAITGELNTRYYDDKDGKRVYVTEVIANNIELTFEQPKEDATLTPPSDIELPF